jgi:PAS domain S-box-containing protein
MATPRIKSLVIGWVALCVLFLATVAFHLALMQRDLSQQGVGEVRSMTAIVLVILGGLLLGIPLYGVLARTGDQKGGRETAGGTRDAVYGAALQLVREKDLELERLRSAAEARAQEIESYNEDILQSVASGVITFDKNRVVTTFNPAAARIWKIAPGRVIGKTCEDVFGAQSKVASLVKACLERGEVITREQFQLQVPDGGKIWVGVSTSLLKDRAGRLIGTTLVCTDLTEIKDLQEQVELQERMTVVGEMSAGIAHEFRNFMGTILGAAKLAAKQLPPRDPALESLQTILHVIKDMDHLITQFLNFARKTELDLKSVALDSWLARVVEQVRGQMPESRHDISIQCSPEVPPILMDEVLMRQAVGNLIQNAIEAMPESGRITLIAAARPSVGRRPEVELKISDTGSGIPKPRLDKVFLPFFTTKTTGTGLGLALVHKIVLLHHGRIEVESEENKGTTFSIYLPIA